MSDLISRERLINEWDELGRRYAMPTTPIHKRAFREFPSADVRENKGEWIPVGWIPNGRCGYPSPEEEYKHFLTIDNKGEMTVQEFLLSLDEEPVPYFTGMRNIVAWQPLPEPYKAESEGDQ